MIFLLLDLFISYFSSYPSFLIILNLVFIPKKDIHKLIIISLFLDLIITNTYFLHTIILTILFILYKKLNITRNTFKNYLISVTFLYLVFTLILALINHKLGFYLPFIFKNYFINLILFLLFYKILENRVKLSK